MKEWVTIREAAVLVGRHPRAIYRWVDKGLLATRVNADGVTEVLSRAVRRVETQVKRGRPLGSVSRDRR